MKCLWEMCMEDQLANQQQCVVLQSVFQRIFKNFNPLTESLLEIKEVIL